MPAIPDTPDAVAAALTSADRARFRREVLATHADEIPAVVRKGWVKAMLDGVPGADVSRANAAAGRELVSLDELVARLEQGGE
ncbi:hypothetical protein [Streptomyces nanshensis]|uniref:hypothetical protein n=1 Tax=Streptomyces nanshensis TaxID=518642 RepID=UPI001FD0F638|nr:hypothetical protein [Streptomyces nanshensis]